MSNARFDQGHRPRGGVAALGREEGTTDTLHPILVDEEGRVIIGAGGGVVVSETYDYIGLAYTADDLTTVEYRLGGAGGTLVATLTLGYDAPGGNLTSVTRT